MSPGIDGSLQTLLGVRAAARAHLSSRQSPGGGFCVFRSAWANEPNLSDTWQAPASLASRQLAVEGLAPLRGLLGPGMAT